MLDLHPSTRLAELAETSTILTSDWLAIPQEMISEFGRVTLDPDPMHIDPEWSSRHSPFGGTIAFGFLTISLLTHLLHNAMGTNPERDTGENGYYLNYGFDRLRLVSPVPVGSRVRGVFQISKREPDGEGRVKTCFDCRIEIEGQERPALVAEWLSYWVAAESA
jgi:acyl dehydratase